MSSVPKRSYLWLGFCAGECEEVEEGAIDSWCLTHVYNMDPNRMVAMEDARPL